VCLQLTCVAVYCSTEYFHFFFLFCFPGCVCSCAFLSASVLVLPKFVRANNLYMAICKIRGFILRKLFSVHSTNAIKI